MKFRFLFLFFSLFAIGLNAQIITPVSWDTRIESLGNDTYALKIIARMDAGWAVYSQYTPEGGPIPTTLNWSTGSHVQMIGQTTEKGHRKEGLDDMFGVDVIKFLSDEDLVFTQKVKVKEFGKPIEVALEFMCCDDEQCLPPTEEFFSFLPQPAGPASGSVAPNKSIPAATQPATPAGNAKIAAAQQPAKDGIIGRTEQKLETRIEQQTEAIASQQVEMTDGDFVKTSFSFTESPATEYDPVTWKLTVTELEPNRYRIEMNGKVEPEWTLYSHELDPNVGPVPNAFIVEEKGLKLTGKADEVAIKLKTVYEDVWEANVQKIYEGVTYVQELAVDPSTKSIEGTMTYMACKEVCLPPEDLPFSINLVNKTATIGYPDDLAATSGNLGSGLASSGDCGVNFDNDPLANCSEGVEEVAGKSLFSIFGLGFLGGLFALIMPCIFPMIPLTVNFFNKGKSSSAEGIRRAGLYGFFIFAIYLLLSVPFHLIEGVSANILNDVASNVGLNIFFFAVFMFFAGSFFGYYELTVPASWSNRSSKAENSGGVVGIFFMALTLALVSFSCTGPILGSLLVGTASEGAWPLTAGMAGFGLALALPFAVFAAFPQLLQNLPSSGGWLNSVKVVLGFVEVALAFKFLSNADLVGKWDVLKIEPFYIIWILCSLGIAAYLFKLISFPLDSKNRKIGLFGGALAVLALVFAGYIGTGFQVDKQIGSYQPLSLLSGIAPSVCYSYWNSCECPQGIPCFKNLDEGMAYACEVGKPVMLDFTGYTCTNCRQMEENVWSKDNIRRILSDDYVLISLYVDDRTELPEAEQEVVDRLDRPGATQRIDRVGRKWHYLQQSVYKKSTQPYYVLVSPEGRTLNPPVSYTANVADYEAFLQCGLDTYGQLSDGSLEATLPVGK